MPPRSMEDAKCFDGGWVVKLRQKSNPLSGAYVRGLRSLSRLADLINRTAPTATTTKATVASNKDCGYASTTRTYANTTTAISAAAGKLVPADAAESLTNSLGPARAPRKAASPHRSDRAQASKAGIYVDLPPNELLAQFGDSRSYGLNSFAEYCRILHRTEAMCR